MVSRYRHQRTSAAGARTAAQPALPRAHLHAISFQFYRMRLRVILILSKWNLFRTNSVGTSNIKALGKCTRAITSATNFYSAE